MYDLVEYTLFLRKQVRDTKVLEKFQYQLLRNKRVLKYLFLKAIGREVKKRCSEFIAWTPARLPKGGWSFLKLTVIGCFDNFCKKRMKAERGLIQKRGVDTFPLNFIEIQTKKQILGIHLGRPEGKIVFQINFNLCLNEISIFCGYKKCSTTSKPNSDFFAGFFVLRGQGVKSHLFFFLHFFVCCRAIFPGFKKCSFVS